MTEIWLKIHVVSDSNCNTVNLESPRFFYKEWHVMFGLTCSVGDTSRGWARRLELATLNTITFSVVHCNSPSLGHCGCCSLGLQKTGANTVLKIIGLRSASRTYWRPVAMWDNFDKSIQPASDGALERVPKIIMSRVCKARWHII